MSSTTKELLRKGLLLAFFVILTAPGFVFFSNRDGLETLLGHDFQTTLKLLFPLVGLYAFTFLWAQFLIGSSSAPLRELFPQIVQFHRRQGLFVFLLALFHPGLLFLALGPEQYFSYQFLPREMVPFALLGTLALFLMTLTALTAKLQKINFLRGKWRIIHYLNYLIFFLVWFHSWKLGSDVQATNLKILWLFYGTTALLSLVWRLHRIFEAKRQWQLNQN